MKISEIYNISRKSSFDVEKIFRLKDWSRSIFNLHNNIGVDWNLLKKNVPGLQGYMVSQSLNTFYTVSLNDKFFILVNYDKVQQFYVPYCTDPITYEIFMKLLLAHSDFSYCSFACSPENNIPLPDEEDYLEAFQEFI
jgi:hypothetical protein